MPRVLTSEARDLAWSDPTTRLIHDLWCREGFVNKTDNYSHDRPLDEVSHSLHQGEFQPDIQVHVVVQHKSANHKNANQNAQARTFSRARSTLMCLYHYHCENYGDNQDRYQTCGHSNWHDSHHFFLGSEYVRVFVGFINKSWHEPHQEEPIGKIR